MEMWIRQKYNTCTDYFVKGEKTVYDLEQMDNIIEQWDPDLEETVKIAVLKDKYLQRGEVSRWYETQKQNDRLKLSFDKDCKATVGLMHQWMDRALQTALYSANGYQVSLEQNDIWKMKMIIKKLMKGQDRATIYKDIANLLACKPDGKDNERERYFKEFAKCVEKLLKREDMTESQILHCIINSIFVHGAQRLNQLREEVKKELMKAIWDDYSILIIKWNEYCQTLDNMGWKDANETDHIQANQGKLYEVKEEERMIELIANKLYKLEGEPDSERKDKLKNLLVNALLRKFQGHCWNCWEKDDYCAINCPIKVKSICDDCAGSHHTNACGLIGKKKTGEKKNLYNKSNSKQKYKYAHKTANKLVKNEDDDQFKMYIANITHMLDNDDYSDLSDEEQKVIHSGHVSTNNRRRNDSDDEEWETESGKYYIGDDMNVKRDVKNITSMTVNLVGLKDNVKKDSSTMRNESMTKIKSYEKEMEMLTKEYNQKMQLLSEKIELEKINIKKSIPWKLTNNYKIILVSRVIKGHVNSFIKELSSYNNYSVLDLISCHEEYLKNVNADEDAIYYRSGNIMESPGSWRCTVDDDLYDNLIKKILSYMETDPTDNKKMNRKNDVMRRMIEQEKLLKTNLSEFKSPVRESKWKLQDEAKDLEDARMINNDIEIIQRDAQLKNNTVTFDKRKICDEFDNEHCNDCAKLDYCGDCNIVKVLSIEEQIKKEEEEDTIREQEYNDWEHSQQVLQVREDYQSRNMRKDSSKYRTPRQSLGLRSNRGGYGSSRVTKTATFSDRVEELDSNIDNNYQQYVRGQFNSPGTATATAAYKARVIKGDDGIYRHMDDKICELIHLDGTKTAVTTKSDLRAYFKYHCF